MKRAGFFGLILLGALCLVSAEQGILAVSEVEPGAVLPVYLQEEDLQAEALLTFSDGRVVSASGFSVSGIVDIIPALLLIGIPCNVQPGPAVLVVSGISGGRPYSIQREIRIVDREFRKETIPLTTALSRLREEEKEARERESRELYHILISFYPESVYDPGPFHLPVVGARVTSWFGDRRTYTGPDGTVSPSIHSGLDLAAPEGTAVYSVGSGRVVLSAGRIITGETVVVEHLPGVYCLYCHLKDRFVETGEQVYDGQVIGTLGMTGLATGPHLHLEFRVGGVPVDPEPLLEKGLLDKETIMSMIGVQD